MNGAAYPAIIFELLQFLCDKYAVDRSRIFVEYSSRLPPPVKGPRAGYYDGLLSFRRRDGHPEFLITIFNVSRNPLLTLAHEFAHLVEDLKLGDFDKDLQPPDDLAEKSFDDQAMRDLAEFESLRVG